MVTEIRAGSIQDHQPDWRFDTPPDALLPRAFRAAEHANMYTGMRTQRSLRRSIELQGLMLASVIALRSASPGFAAGRDGSFQHDYARLPSTAVELGRSPSTHLIEAIVSRSSPAVYTGNIWDPVSAAHHASPFHRIVRHIEELPSPYKVVVPIPIQIEVPDSGEPTAHFRDAGMAMTGTDGADALDNLRAFILDCLDDWKEASADTLGPIPRRQLAKIREHVRWT